MARWLRCVLLVVGGLVQVPSWAVDLERLVVSLETNQLDVSVDFAGTELKAVGTMDGPGDLIVKVAGPQQEAKLSREVELGPFWLHGETVRMTGAPSLLYLYGTRPIAAILPPAERTKYGLLLEGQPLALQPPAPAQAAEDWRKAFVRLKANAGYYREDDSAIRVIRDRMFVLGIRLPGNLQPGTYRVETLYVKSGNVLARNVQEFDVRLAGIERWVWTAAHDHSWLFGTLFTLVAAIFGFVLNALPLRRR